MTKQKKCRHTWIKLIGRKRSDVDKTLLEEIQKNPVAKRKQYAEAIFGEHNNKACHTISDKTWQLKKEGFILKTASGEFKLTEKGEKYLGERQEKTGEEPKRKYTKRISVPKDVSSVPKNNSVNAVPKHISDSNHVAPPRTCGRAQGPHNPGRDDHRAVFTGCGFCRFNNQVYDRGGGIR